MASRDRPRRPARYSRWAASGLTAAVTVGAVGAMVEVEPNDSLDDFGSRDNVGVAMGAVAGYEGRVSAAAMMAAADPGIDAPPPVPLPTIGRAGVS